jgi:hypothetical protein
MVGLSNSLDYPVDNRVYRRPPSFAAVLYIANVVVVRMKFAVGAVMLVNASSFTPSNAAQTAFAFSNNPHRTCRGELVSSGRLALWESDTLVFPDKMVLDVILSFSTICVCSLFMLLLAVVH